MQSEEEINKMYEAARLIAATLFNDRNGNYFMGGDLAHWIAAVQRYETILQIPDSERLKAK